MALIENASFNRALVYVLTRALPAPLRNPLLRFFLQARNAYFGQYLDFKGKIVFGKNAVVGRKTVVKANAAIGDGVKIGRGVTIEDLEEKGGETIIDESVVVGDECVLDSSGGLEIGVGARLSREVIIYTHEHRGKGGRTIELKPVKIEAGATIGARAIILRGVTIGENSAVGAGAVVTKNVAGGATVAGVPAKEIRKRGKRGTGRRKA